MPTYTITDPQTGRKVKVRGDSPPTEQELTEIFSKLPGTDNGTGARQPGPDTSTETDNPDEAYQNSLLQTAGDTASGIGRGLVNALNPVSLAKGAWGLAEAMHPAPEHQPAREALWQGAKQTASGIASGDPGTGGEAIGGLLGGLLLPKVPGAVSATGRGVEAAGEALSTMPGGLMARGAAGMFGGGPKGAIAAMAGPPTLKGFGRVMQRTGGALQSGLDALELPAPRPRTGPVASSAVPAAAGPTEMGTLPMSRVQPQSPRPVESAPAPGPVALGRDPGFTRAPEMAPVSSHGPQPQTLPGPSLDTMTQDALLEQLAGPAPLGSLPASQSPRVKAWKPGYGPSAGDAEALRSAYGSKTAAQLLKTRQDQVQSLAPTTGPSQLPSQVGGDIGAQFLAADPGTRAQMIQTAPNQLVRQLLESLNQAMPTGASVPPVEF